MSFRACWTFALVSPTCARLAREWIIWRSIFPSMSRLSVRRCCNIGQRRSPSRARRPQASSTDDRRKQLRWADNRSIKTFLMSSYWPRLPAPRRATGPSDHGRSWRTGSEILKLCRAFLLDVRPKVLFDEDYAGCTRLSGDLERPRTGHGADERQVQGDGLKRLSRCGQGEGEQQGVLRPTLRKGGATKSRRSLSFAL
jgi:hypothetical protein